MKNRAEKIICIIFCAVFVVLATVPLFGMLFYDAEEQSGEQRSLAEFPEFNLDFPENFEDYFCDRFAFRSQLVDFGSSIMQKVFKTSAEDDVIVGSNDFLYYGETTEDYCGTKEVSDAEIKRIAKVICLESEYCENNGAGYVFVIAPNKNSIYPEYMPSNYEKSSEISVYDRLLAEISGDVACCDLKTLLISEKDGVQLYYSQDSHWNLLGARIAYNDIIGKIEEITEEKIDRTEVSEYKKTLLAATREDDLLKMLRPLNSEYEEEFAKCTAEENYTYAGRLRSLDDGVIETNTESGTTTLNLLMFRDSFGRALIGNFSETFANAKYVRAVPFDIYNNISENTVVVREIVERNIDTLDDTAPMAVAPERTAGSVENLSQTGDFDVEYNEQSGLYYICGVAEGNADYTQVIVKLSDGKFYEAFPVTDEKFGEVENKVGFALWLENEEKIEKVYFN